MQIVFKSLAALALSLLAPLASAQNMPAGALSAGSLATQKLIDNATLAVMANVARQGCRNAQNFAPYVMRNPVTKGAAKMWQEKWLVFGCGKRYTVDLLLMEDGAGGTDYTILQK
jgi:hypothetical protein